MKKTKEALEEVLKLVESKHRRWAKNNEKVTPEMWIKNCEVNKSTVDPILKRIRKLLAEYEADSNDLEQAMKDLELFDTLQVAPMVWVMRVPGGHIYQHYHYDRIKTNRALRVASTVFVPDPVKVEMTFSK